VCVCVCACACARSPRSGWEYGLDFGRSRGTFHLDRYLAPGKGVGYQSSAVLSHISFRHT